MCEKLGEGHFGEVREAIWLTTNGEIRVAVKMLKKDADNAEKIKLLQEAAVLGQFNHPNIVTLYGVVTLGKPVSHYDRHGGEFQLGLKQYEISHLIVYFPK